MIDGTLSSSDFTARWSEILEGSTLEVRPRRDLVVAVGMVMSSIERHLLFDGELEGASWMRVPFAEALILDLTPSGDPPREVIASYVRGPDFIGGAAEWRFKAQVTEISSRYRDILEAVAPLTEPAAWSQPEAADRLRSARIWMETVRFMFLEQVRAIEAERHEFRDLLRGFFRGHRIGGVPYEGVNAAHEPGAMALDLVFGIADDHYRSYVDPLRRHLLAEDRAWFDQRAAGGSLLGTLGEVVGRPIQNEAVALRVFQIAQPWIRDRAADFARLIIAHSAASAAHMAVIRSVLQKDPSTTKTVTPPSLGTGGRPHEHTRGLLLTRQAAAKHLKVLLGPEDRGIREGGEAG